MRGRDDRSDGLFSYVRLEKRIPDDHPLRPIRKLVDEVLKQMSVRLDALYAATGRPSIAPEMLLRATLLQAFFSVRSERQLMEQIDYNLLFRWFGLFIKAQASISVPHRGRGATASATSTRRSGRTRRMPRRRTRMRGSIARPMAARAGCASWGMS